MNKTPVIVIVIIVAVVGVLVFRFIAGMNDGVWVCDHGQWVQRGNTSSPKPTQACSLTGSNINSLPYNANENADLSVSAKPCALVSEASECLERNDCLTIDFCSCTTENEQVKKCGGAKSGCRCETGGFRRCETIDCSTVRTNKSKAEEEYCLAKGGEWGLFGRLQTERCNLPAADANKECRNGDECEAGWCLALSDLSTTDLGANAIGHCPDQRLVAGCLQIVEAGLLGTVCID